MIPIGDPNIHLSHLKSSYKLVVSERVN